MQTLVSVVNYRERKMLSALLAVSTEAQCSSVMVNHTAGVERAPKLSIVNSTEQDKPVSLSDEE